MTIIETLCEAVWLNTMAAPRPEELAGRVILLDFWTYG